MSLQVLHNQPATSDGKPIFLPNLFPGNVTLYIVGAADDAAQGRGKGPSLQLSSDVAGDSTLEFSFNDWLYIAGGGVMWESGSLGDYATLELYAPATPVAPDASNQGNCDLVDPGVGAAILLVPSPGRGTHNCDLAQATPIPAYADESETGNGYFDFWSEPDTGKGTIAPASNTGQGRYNLFAASIPMAQFAARIPLLGTHGAMDLTVSAIKPKRVLPQWKFKLTLHNSGHVGLKLAAYLVTARVKTT